MLCFENKGDVVGVSNPHPHGQIYATGFVWKTMEIELAASAPRIDAPPTTGRGLMDDVIRAEQQGGGPRVLHEDEHVIAFVPYFARYAYEVYVVPKRRVPHVFALNDAEVAALARALSAVTIRFDNLWRMSFPYVMVLHQAPIEAHGDAGSGAEPAGDSARSTSSSRFIRRCGSRTCSSTWPARRSAAATSCRTRRPKRPPPS